MLRQSPASVLVLLVAACAAVPVALAAAPERCDAEGSESCAVEEDESKLLQLKAFSDSKKAEVFANASSYTYDQEKARAFAMFAKMTYCSAGKGTAGSVQISCGGNRKGAKGYCEKLGVQVKKGSVRTIMQADGDSKKALVSYVAVLQATPGETPSLTPGCVVAIRGTWPKTNNKVRNNEVELVAPKWGTDTTAKVHKGFQHMWGLLMPRIENSLKSVGCKVGSTPLYMTGHSMGGATATMGMYAMKAVGWDVQPSYMFHNPKTGDANFVKAFNTLIAGSPDKVAVTRITHYQDNVPDWYWGKEYVYAHPFPEVHYFNKHENEPGDHSSEYEICWEDSTDCGYKKYKTLCKQSECDDHLINPIAPNDNIGMFKDFSTTCFYGKGVVKVGALPVEKGSADDQLEWLDQHIPDEAEKCVDGWAMAPDCVDEFNYYGTTIKGCTMRDAWTPDAWCSMEALRPHVERKHC